VRGGLRLILPDKCPFVALSIRSKIPLLYDLHGSPIKADLIGEPLAVGPILPNASIALGSDNWLWFCRSIRQITSSSKPGTCLRQYAVDCYTDILFPVINPTKDSDFS